MEKEKKYLNAFDIQPSILVYRIFFLKKKEKKWQDEVMKPNTTSTGTEYEYLKKTTGISTKMMIVSLNFCKNLSNIRIITLP